MRVRGVGYPGSVEPRALDAREDQREPLFQECPEAFCPLHTRERDFFIDNLLVRVHFIIVMIRWTGLAPWEFDAREDQREPLFQERPQAFCPLHTADI